MKFAHYTVADLARKISDIALPLASYRGPEHKDEPCLGFLVQDFGQACLVVSRMSIFWDETLGLKDQECWKEFEAALLTARHHVDPDRGLTVLYFPDIQVGELT